MERKAVQSGAIAEVGYDAETHTLEVMFPSGRIWQYADVPQEVYDRFISAASLGRFFAADIRACYVSTCMNPKPKEGDSHGETPNPDLSQDLKKSIKKAKDKKHIS